MEWKTATTTMLMIAVTLLRMVELASSQDGEPKDYCEADTFAANCPKNHVIFMTSALYGRMKVGSCVKKDLGHIGCYSDVMRQADNRCSGKRSCQIRIPDSEFDLTRPCHEELKTYLEASYRCIQVEVPKDGNCNQGGMDHPFVVHIGSGMGHISSSLYASTKCSSETWPIRIVAFPGQRINITVFDFRHATASPGNELSRFQQQQQQPWLQGRKRRSDISTTTIFSTTTSAIRKASFHLPGMTTAAYKAPVWKRKQLRIKRSAESFQQKLPIKSSSSSSSGHLQQHGEADCSFHVVIQDRHAARRLRVCPSQLRQRSVYVSSNHSVEIFFKKELQTVVVGQQPQQQPTQRQQQQENIVGEDLDRFLVRYEVVGCEDLKLPEDMWKNKVGAAVEVGCKDSEHKWSLRCVTNKWDGLPGNCSKAALFGISSINDADLNSLPHGMAIAVVLCVALLMGLTVLIIGALGLLLRRFHKKSTRHSSSAYGVHGKQGSGSATPSQRMLPGSSNNVMLSSQDFFDYPDQRKQQHQQQQHRHHHQQQQQQPLQRCVGCNAALADYYATLSHRRCIIPQCDDSFPVASTDSGTVLSNILLQESDENGPIEASLSTPGKACTGFDLAAGQADDYTQYPGQAKLQYARESEYQCTLAGGVCSSKTPSFEGPHLSTSAVWKQQKKPNYCPVLDDKTFSRLENLHGCT